MMINTCTSYQGAMPFLLLYVVNVINSNSKDSAMLATEPQFKNTLGRIPLDGATHQNSRFCDL